MRTEMDTHSAPRELQKLVETSEAHWTEVEWSGLTSKTHYVELDLYKY